LKIANTLALLLLFSTVALAQLDTLKYDAINNVNDGQLMALTTFRGEGDVSFTARFTPTEKCSINGVILGFGLVKFKPVSGNDSLIVCVYEVSPVPPRLNNIVATYKFNLGDQGFPAPNINYTDPLNNGLRAERFFPFNPQVPISPKREFIIGVRPVGNQLMKLDSATWRGFAILISTNNSEFNRFGRYSTGDIPANAMFRTATDAGRVGLYIRAVVQYDPNMPIIIPTTVDRSTPQSPPSLLENYPNPFRASTQVTFSLPQRQHVALTMFDALGRQVVRLLEGEVSEGIHHATFEPVHYGYTNPAGIFYARLVLGQISITRAVLYMR